MAFARPSLIRLATSSRQSAQSVSRILIPRNYGTSRSGILMLGYSSDHSILDITDSIHSYHLGDIIDLIPGYFSLMRAFTSKYIQKSF